MIFIFLLALIIFGPKRLPQLAREVGKFVGEFKRASNDFKSQLQAEIERAGKEGGSEPPAAQRSGGAQISGPAAEIPPPALASTAQPPANLSASVLDTDRERLLRTAHLAFEAQNPLPRTPLVPDTTSEPPPAPLPAHPGRTANLSEESAAGASDASAASPSPGADGSSTSDAAEAAIEAPPKG